MRIVAKYSLNGGEDAVLKKYPHLLEEIQFIVASVDSENHRTKISKEKTMRGAKLYSPRALNKAFDIEFHKFNWERVRVKGEYPTDVYEPGYEPPHLNRGAFREMDFVKEKLGVEIQFG